MASIFTIKTTDVNREGRRWIVNFETDAHSVAELYARLQEDRIIYGSYLHARTTEDPKVLVVVRRSELVLGREAVHSIEVPNRRFVEEGLT